ncbi:MAG: hypothetical protein JNL43_15625 [Flavobacteriales bacterium]|nr:hypothetical protein [Flavobacteriales bacterium]
MAQPFIPKDLLDEPPSDAWTYVPNLGQNYDLAGHYRSDVLFSSVGTLPAIFLMKQNRIGIVVPELDPIDPSNSRINRVDLEFVETHNETSPALAEPTGHQYNFYETYTPHGITGVQGGKRVVYKDVYPDIDVHMYSNRWGP